VGGKEWWFGNRTEIQVVLGRLKEFASPGRCTGWSSSGQAQVGENLDDHGGIFNGRDEGQGAAALWIGCQVDREDAFESLRPTHPGLW